MMKIAFIAATAVAVLMTAPFTAPAKAQGVDVRIGGDHWRPWMARCADHCQEQNAASYRQEPQRQGERQCSDHKPHKGQLGVVARCQMSRRPPNWYAI